MRVTKLDLKKYSRLIATLAVLGFALTTSIACGGDEAEEGGDAEKKKKAKKGKKKRKKKRRRKGARIDMYSKVAPELRRPLKDVDFRPDATGDLNRDPFRSYVVSQPAQGTNQEGTDEEVEDNCRAEKTRRKPQTWFASKYSVRSLRLIGIVLGRKSYALFRDTAGLGHIVQKNHCVGKEKAIVDDIGTGFVRLQVAAEAAAGTTAPPEKRNIALYPEEAVLDPLDATGSDDAEDEPADSGGDEQ